MAQTERRTQPCMFKLRCSVKEKARFRELTASGGGWSNAGDGRQPHSLRSTIRR